MKGHVVITDREGESLVSALTDSSQVQMVRDQDSGDLIVVFYDDAGTAVRKWRFHSAAWAHALFLTPTEAEVI